MPRTLPWLLEQPEKTAKSSPRLSSPPKRKPPPSETSDLVDGDLNSIHPSPERKKQQPNHPQDRSPSTSPPPAPPDVDYMREGYNADDIYRMVEDEFYSTAQSFTQHIHRAEYVRLKKLARARGAGVLREIGRGTDGVTGMSGGLKLRLEGEELVKKRKAGTGDGESSEEDEEDAYMQDPQLAGLMTEKLRPGKDLVVKGKVRAKTRAAAGLEQSPKNVERVRDVLGNDPGLSIHATEDEDDDLDGPTVKSARLQHPKSERNRQQSNISRERRHVKDDSVSKTSSPSKHRMNTSAATRGYDARVSLSTKRTITSDSGLADRVTEPAVSKESAREWLAKRRADKERKEREEKRKAKVVDDIPTFLF